MTARQWTVVGLLVLSVVINYVDRANLSLAAPMIQHVLALTPVQLGELLSAFFWTYALMQMLGIAGWLSDRFPVGWVMLCGYVLWSGATVLTGLVHGFAALFAARLLLGFGESVAYPCYSRIFATLPQENRGRANALIDAGTKLGPATGAFVGGLLLVHFGWRVLFLALGAGGLLWVLPWMALMPEPHPVARGGEPHPVAKGGDKDGAPDIPHPVARSGDKDGAPRQDLPSIGKLLRLPEAWGAFLGHFCGNYFFYFLLAWLPNYLSGEEKLGIGAMSRLTSGVFLLIAASTLLAGGITDKLIEAGVSTTRVRRAAVVGGLGVASSLMLLLFVHRNLPVSLAVMAVACVGYGAFASNHWAIAQTLAGPLMAGRWSSVQNGIANLSGIAAPWVAGMVLQESGSSRLAFVITGGVAAVGACSWGMLVRRVEPVRWELVDGARG